jgi:signal transduction histidine kinase
MSNKEQLLNEVYNNFFDIALCINLSFDKLDEIVINDHMGFGTAIDEKLFSLDDVKKLALNQLRLLQGVTVAWERSTLFQRISADGNSAIIAEDIVGHIKVDNESMQMYLRFSCVLEYNNNKWMVIHFHGSKPEDVLSDVDGFGMDKWRQKNLALEKLVAERTTDLQLKNSELETALLQLNATQKQLIQAEKMASLGELTAGIAHEIQNPLNFVNNFSEVSNELLQELLEERNKEQSARDEQLENELLIDIKQNLEKINHHGKRADAIVKGMLQHSRTSSAVKEPTDINALCDEYLRLSYHGLRAKDKNFNATMKTDFDPSLEKINIIPQDIGRVVLNLLTNAFYVVDEKKKNPQPQQEKDQPYQPTVSVKTLKNQLSGGRGAEVLISVTDNGNGIPQKVMEKIFLPFFTTKPTGKGTGLGLSLSYDIVKAHGGEIKIETKEGEGSTFIIQIPII